jgi:hypothetical protein
MMAMADDDLTDPGAKEPAAPDGRCHHQASQRQSVLESKLYMSRATGTPMAAVEMDDDGCCRTIQRTPLVITTAD